MNEDFHLILSQLRREKGISQRSAAEALLVSQALLSHYENGIREPGLAFVTRACDYYGVSADYLLGRTPDRDGMLSPSHAPERVGRANHLQRSVHFRKPLVGSLALLFDLLSKLEDTAALNHAARYLSGCLWGLIAQLLQAAGQSGQTDLLYTSEDALESGLQEARTQLERSRYALALRALVRQRKALPPLSGEALHQEYPNLYPAWLDLAEENAPREEELPPREENTPPSRRRRGARIV